MNKRSSEFTVQRSELIEKASGLDFYDCESFPLTLNIDLEFQ